MSRRSGRRFADKDMRHSINPEHVAVLQERDMHGRSVALHATPCQLGRPPEPRMSPRPDLGPKPKLGYTASQIERAADRRHDAAGRFAIGIAPAAAETLKARDDLLVTDLRSIAVQGLVAAEHLPPIAEAKALLGWHARHRFCANCGAPTAPVEAGWKRECAACKTEHFPRTDPVVIMLAVRGDECLLGRSARFASAMWSCLAGFIEPGESIEEAVRREVHEEAGIVCGRVAYFASQPWPFPMSLMMLRRHPQGLGTPPPVAIAHHIIRAWVEAEAGAFAQSTHPVHRHRGAR